MAHDANERDEQRQRSRAWYAILGLGALTAGAIVVLRWIPDNPFNSPSELPGTSRYNADQLTGTSAPMLAAPPSAAASVGAGCRLGDVALVQNWRGPLRQTPTDVLLARGDRAHARGRRFDVVGWSARGEDDPGDARDGGDGTPTGATAGATAGTTAGTTAGCAVTFAWRDERGEHRAVWDVSPDRRAVTPTNDLAREITNAPPSARR